MLVAIGVVIIGGERLVNLISPPTWFYYAFAAGGVILLWNCLPKQQSIAGSGTRAR